MTKQEVKVRISFIRLVHPLRQCFIIPGTSDNGIKLSNKDRIKIKEKIRNEEYEFIGI